MGSKRHSKHEYGDYTMILNQHQGLLKDGSYIRARMTDGSWQELKIYSKHRKAWYNVLRPGEEIVSWVGPANAVSKRGKCARKSRGTLNLIYSAGEALKAPVSSES